MTDPKPFRFQFFIPNARILSHQEVTRLPPEKVRGSEAEGRNGVWLEVPCPDRSCLDDKGNLTIPTHASKSEKGVFLNLFCPEDACEIVQSTDLP